MGQVNRSAVLGLAVALVLVLRASRADNEGQDDLNKARAAKINARTSSDLADVIRFCESALARGLDEVNTEIAKKLLASALSKRGIDSCKSIFDSSPPDPRWPQWRRVALEDLEKAVKLDPQQAEAFYRIAQLNLLPEGDLKRALEALDQAIGQAKSEPVLQAQALVLRAGLQKDPARRLADLNEADRIVPGDAAVLRARGLAHAEVNKLAEALADLEASLKLDPKHVRALEEKALVLGRMKKFEESKAALQEARQLDPNSAEPLIYEARVCAMVPDLPAAVALLTEALRKEPSNVEVLLRRADYYAEMDEKGKARADLERTLELRPGLPPALRMRALLAAGEGQWGDAIADLKELLQDDPDDVEVRLQLGMLYSGADRHQDALETFAKLIAEDPKSWMALRGRGDALLNVGQHAEAIADYEKACAIKPDDSGLLNNLAWVLATSPVDKLRNGKRALELAREACRLTEHKQAHILSTLAAAHAELGDFKAALEWSQKAVALGRKDQMADLLKELESYKAGKPFRELKSSGPKAPAEPKKSAKPKPTQEERAKPKPLQQAPVQPKSSPPQPKAAQGKP